MDKVIKIKADTVAFFGILRVQYVCPSSAVVIAMLFCCMMSVCGCAKKNTSPGLSQLRAAYLSVAPINTDLDERVELFDVVRGDAAVVQAALVRRSWSGAANSRKAFSHLVLFEGGRPVGRWPLHVDLNMRNTRFVDGALLLVLASEEQTEVDLQS